MKQYRGLFIQCLAAHKRHLVAMSEIYANKYDPSYPEVHGYSTYEMAGRYKEDAESFDIQLYTDIFDKNSDSDIAGLEPWQIIHYLRIYAMDRRKDIADFPENPWIKIGAGRDCVCAYWFACELYPRIGELYTVGDFANCRINIQQRHLKTGNN